VQGAGFEVQGAEFQVHPISVQGADFQITGQGAP
jgi:hypothetical protein